MSYSKLCAWQSDHLLTLWVRMKSSVTASSLPSVTAALCYSTEHFFSQFSMEQSNKMQKSKSEMKLMGKKRVGQRPFLQTDPHLLADSRLRYSQRFPKTSTSTGVSAVSWVPASITSPLLLFQISVHARMGIALSCYQPLRHTPALLAAYNTCLISQTFQHQCRCGRRIFAPNKYLLW